MQPVFVRDTKGVSYDDKYRARHRCRHCSWHEDSMPGQDLSGHYHSVQAARSNPVDALNVLTAVLISA